MGNPWRARARTAKCWRGIWERRARRTRSWGTAGRCIRWTTRGEGAGICSRAGGGRDGQALGHCRRRRPRRRGEEGTKREKGRERRDRAGCAESAGTDENAAHEIDARVRGVVHGEEPAHGHGRARAFLEGGVNRWLLLTPFVERLQEESSRVARSNARFSYYVPLVEQRESASRYARASYFYYVESLFTPSTRGPGVVRRTPAWIACARCRWSSPEWRRSARPATAKGARSRTACPSSDDSA